MGLNIESGEIEKLARRLAETTGEQLDAAILRALEERLDRELRIAERREKLREILDRVPPSPPGVTSDHSDLYNEYGGFDDR